MKPSITSIEALILAVSGVDPKIVQILQAGSPNDGITIELKKNNGETILLAQFNVVNNKFNFKSFMGEGKNLEQEEFDFFVCSQTWITFISLVKYHLKQGKNYKVDRKLISFLKYQLDYGIGKEIEIDKDEAEFVNTLFREQIAS